MPKRWPPPPEPPGPRPIRRLPQGYDTVLGKWFGGAELSVGEWQRVALARAFLRRSTLMILDEPTSAMDSWAESDWLAGFAHWRRGIPPS